MIVDNKFGYPNAIVEAAQDILSKEHNEDGCVSATTLLRGAKETILTHRHFNEIHVDVDSVMDSMRGTAFHEFLSHYDQKNFTETKFSYDVEGMTVTGTLDVYNEELRLIQDYKNCKVWKVVMHDFDEWKKQGLIYAWLLSKNGHKANKLSFYAFFEDWSPSQAKADNNYPQCKMYVYSDSISENDIKGIEAFVHTKVKYLNDCNKLDDDDIPECSESERWKTETVYAVYKNQNKTATKLFHSSSFNSEKEAYDAAEIFAGSLDDAKTTTRIEERLGESKKCERYCVCKEFCSFYKKNHKE